MVESLTFEQRANRYADAVISGEIVAGEYVKRACIRHALDLSRQGADDFPFVFNPLMRDSHGNEYRPGERVCTFIELLPHVKGKWAKARESITLEDWQVFNLVSAFGWIHKDTALRRFRTIYLEVARKNAKTTLAAGVGLYLEIADDEAGAEVYSCATSADQAKISWNIAKQMVEKSPGMQKRFGVTPHAQAIAVQRTASTFQYLSSDHKTLDGLNTSGAIIDEVHAHRTREVYDVMETSTGSREQPMLFNITTSGTNRAGVCFELRGYTVKLLRQAANDDTSSASSTPLINLTKSRASMATTGPTRRAGSRPTRTWVYRSRSRTCSANATRQKPCQAGQTTLKLSTWTCGSTPTWNG